jgi:hypothetical protein
MSFRIFLSAITVATILFASLAQADSNSVTVTIYNQNRALVNEIREISVPQGSHTVEFKDVPETIDATSLQVRSLTSPEDFKILDQNYEYDLINVQNLLNKYVGKRLRVVLPDPRGPRDSKIIKEATLLSNNDRPIFLIDGSDDAGSEVYVGNYESVLLPEIPEGLRPQPTLVWLVSNQGVENQRIEVSYLADSMNWKADYVLKLDRENTLGSLSGWVTLENQSGKAFKNARLKLVAGDVHQVSRQRGYPEAKERSLMAAPAEDAMQQESMFEYHLYSLGRTVDISNRQTKQVALLQSPELKVEKRLVGMWGGQFYESGRRGIEKQKLGVFLKFMNNQENGIGVPLPKGIIRAYQESSDGTVIFIGEDTIDHTGKDREVELKMGEAFDVVIERRQTDYRKTGTNTIRYGWELTIKNSKDVPQRVEIEETLPGDWIIIESNMKYEKIDAHRIRFIVDAPPSSSGKDAVVTYQAEVTW